MYKYSKQAQRRFFESPALAFLFAWFALSGNGLRFTETKYSEKGHEYLERIMQEIRELRGQAIAVLGEHACKAKAQGISPMLNKYITVTCSQ